MTATLQDVNTVALTVEGGSRTASNKHQYKTAYYEHIKLYKAYML